MELEVYICRKEIKRMANSFNDIEKLSEEKAREAFENASSLGLGSEEREAEAKIAKTYAEIAMEAKSRRAESEKDKDERKKFYVRCALDVAAIALPLLTYRISLKDVTKFEEVGSYCSSVGRSLTNRLTDFLKIGIRK